MVRLFASSPAVIQAIEMALKPYVPSIEVISSTPIKPPYKLGDDLIIVDWDFAEKFAQDFDELISRNPKNIIALVGRQTKSAKLELEAKGVKCVLEKPFDEKNLIAACGLSGLATLSAVVDKPRQVPQKTQPVEVSRYGAQTASSTIVLPEDFSARLERAVFAYCHEHFASIAKDVIRAEIKTLADEKSKKLL